jgi:hypothetical protein
MPRVTKAEVPGGWLAGWLSSHYQRSARGLFLKNGRERDGIGTDGFLVSSPYRLAEDAEILFRD